MEIRQFQIVMNVWYLFFFAILTFCVIWTVLSARHNNKRFIVSYVLEGVTVSVNLFFMYIINGRYIDYGNDKFSGLSSLGDWLGFGILILITLIPLAITIICNIRYIIKKKTSKQAILGGE